MFFPKMIKFCVCQIEKAKLNAYEEIENNKKDNKKILIYPSLAIKIAHLPNYRAIGRTYKKEMEITFIECQLHVKLWIWLFHALSHLIL